MQESYSKGAKLWTSFAFFFMASGFAPVKEHGNVDVWMAFVLF